MGRFVVDFQDIDQTQVAIVGGKGAHLGELSRIEGIHVPRGVCVTTDAFQRIMAGAPSIDESLDRLSHLEPDAREQISALSAEVRRVIEGVTIPDDLAAAITGALGRLGESEQAAYAVRSSATAEDLPTASFAGQQDSYLNVVGPAAILRHVSRCWASLFTERAVTYRLRNGFDHRKVHMAVVVQRMVNPAAAGVLFTADPVTSNRKVASVEACFGFGEALVAGTVNPDVYTVRNGEIVTKAVVAPDQPALTDGQVLRLEQLGRRIEAHFGLPQDIEWCLVDDDFHFVQKEQELLQRLRALPDGEPKAEETKRKIDRVRTFIGYREYPKYGMISRFFVYKQALLDEAERLVHAHVLRQKEDIFYLTFAELHDAVRTNQVDDRLIRTRRDAFRSYQALTPPRVLTSDGECIAGAYRRDDLPAGALVGLPVSAGTIEGRARVILDMADADLEAGDILVTAYTDPSWTPLFVAIKGVVTEVGGLMTHGAVIAREYGLPAVVGVEHATRLIRDGQWIRLHGTDGYVEILP